MNILIIEDEYSLADAVAETLKSENYSVCIKTNGEDGEDEALTGTYDLILLDVMLPGKNGFEILKYLRKEKIKTPVIMLTAKSEIDDKLNGLEHGADDYITKPFSPLEVCARVKSQLRRYLSLGAGATKTSVVLTIGGLELDYDARTVTLDGENVSLTKKEFDILKLLMENPNRVFSPKEIYREVWHEDPMGADNTVAVHIRHLREKTEIDPADPRYIKVVFGQGYKIQKGN